MKEVKEIVLKEFENELNEQEQVYEYNPQTYTQPSSSKLKVKIYEQKNTQLIQIGDKSRRSPARPTFTSKLYRNSGMAEDKFHITELKLGKSLTFVLYNEVR